MAAGVVAFVFEEMHTHLFVLILPVSRVRLGAAFGVFIAPLLASATCTCVENRYKGGS